MTSYSGPLSTGLYFTLNGTLYLPGDTINITDVGDNIVCGYGFQDPGLSLVCVTSNVNTMCCRSSDHPGNGSVGDWFYPDGTMVLSISANSTGDFNRSSHTQQIRLNRKIPNVMSPTGVYTCQIPDGSNPSLIHTASITLANTGK